MSRISASTSATSFFFAVNVPPTAPPIDIRPDIVVGLSIVPL